MTDLYKALRAAMTPDGRVRMTRELLTAMHEEGERRSRMDAAGEESACAAYNRGHHDGYAEADRDTLDAMAQPHGTPIGVALVRYRERFAALMRERAEAAECERDDLLAHARACLDPEIVSRDPAHARLAALVERIEGGR